MSTKQELTANLRAAYEDWDRLLSTADEQLAARSVTSKWVLKDVVAHLMGWQQLSIARLEAAIAGREPELPAWLGGGDPYAEENTDEYNANIHRAHQAEPWPEAYRAWRKGFARVMELAEAIPEQALLEPRRYSWLRGYPLSGVLEGTCEHHREHLEVVLRALGKR